MDQSLQVLIVGRGGALAEALVRLLEKDGIAAACVRPREVDKTAQRHRPGTLLLEATTSLTSLQMCAEAARRHCLTVQVLLLGTDKDCDETLAARLNAAGIAVTGIVSGDMTAQELVAKVKGLQTTRTTGRHRASIAGARRSDALGQLTNRELEILRIIMAGVSNAGVAEKLQISTHTVRSHVQNILTKLNASTRLEAALIGFRGGLRPLYDREAGTVKT